MQGLLKNPILGLEDFFIYKVRYNAGIRKPTNCRQRQAFSVMEPTEQLPCCDCRLKIRSKLSYYSYFTQQQQQQQQQQ